MSSDLPSGAHGFVNGHTHMYGGLAPLGMPGPAERPASLVEILARVWWRLDRALDERALRAAARLYVAEALLHGTTTLIDHHESPNWIDGSLDVLADACDDLGIRALLCFGATERNGGRDEAQRGLAECRRFIRANRRPLVRGVVGLHASFTVSDETILEAAELCARLGTVLHAHVAEGRVDVDDAIVRHYRGPLQRLQILGALRWGSIVAHGVHLTADDVRTAERLGCWIVQNPRSNAANGVGYAAALHVSARVALGTDGFVSDMRAEAAALAGEAARHGEPREVAATRLDAGQRLVAERFGAAEDRCEFGPDGRVRHVDVQRRPVVRDGALLTGDIDEIRRRAAEVAPEVWSRMAEMT